MTSKRKDKPATPVDLAALGRWESEREIVYAGQTVKVWIRTLGSKWGLWQAGAEARRRALAAIERDPEAKESYLANLLYVEREDMVERLLERERPRLEERVLRGMPDPLCNRQPDETDDAWDQRLEEHEKRCEDRAGERLVEVDRLLAVRRAEFESLNPQSLAALCLPLELEAAAALEAQRAIEAQILYEGVFRADAHDQRQFRSPAEALGLHDEVRRLLLDAYDAVDAGMAAERQDGDPLPNS